MTDVRATGAGDTIGGQFVRIGGRRRRYGRTVGVGFDYPDIVGERGERFGALARTTPHELRLPHLPRWTVHDVVAHLTGDHAWALDILTNLRAPRRGLAKDRRRGEALCARFDEETAELLVALRVAAAEPDAPCPNFAEGADGRVGWWPRHQAHEAVVHLWDLEAATGAHTPLDPQLCIAVRAFLRGPVTA